MKNVTRFFLHNYLLKSIVTFFINIAQMESTVYLFDPLGKEPIQLVQLRLSSKGISGSTQIAFCHRPLSEGFIPNTTLSTENSFLFATCHTQSALLFWELTVSSGKDQKIVSVKKFTFSTCHEELQKLKGVTAIGFSKSGTLFATGHKTGEVHIWNLLNKSEHTILHSRRPITLIDWSYKKDELIALSEDNILKVSLFTLINMPILILITYYKDAYHIFNTFNIYL